MCQTAEGLMILMIRLTLWSVWSKMCQDRSYGLEQIVYSMKGSTCPFWSWWSGKTEISIVPLHENVSRPLDGLDCNLCGSRRKCPFDLERVDKQLEVLSILLECVKTASGLECKSTSGECTCPCWSWRNWNRKKYCPCSWRLDDQDQVNCEGLIFTLLR